MARYVSRPRQWEEDEVCGDPPLMTSIAVWESDPVWTGLLDAQGNDICRTNDPIGFHF